MDRVRDLLARNDITAGAWGEPVFVPAHTRRRATFAAVMRGGKLFFGYHKARSHMVTDIPSCLILSPRLQGVTDALRPHLPVLLADGQDADIFVQDTGMAVDLLITGQVGPRREPQLKQREAMAAMAQDAQLARVSWRLRARDEPETIVQPAPVLKMMGDLPVALPPGAFMQPSKMGEDALLAAVLSPLRAADAQNMADLFAGCGTFTGPMLALGSVTAVESDGPAAQALSDAARGVRALRVEKRNLFTDPLGAPELNRFDAVLFDPPRAGAFAQAQAMAQSDVGLLVGVSCNPATFARDARVLCDGGYTLQSLHIVDQFTWSAHVELVGVFTR
jgi:23S rRNA (uracil1939-C5)-methyltransferase